MARRNITVDLSIDGEMLEAYRRAAEAAAQAMRACTAEALVFREHVRAVQERLGIEEDRGSDPVHDYLKARDRARALLIEHLDEGQKEEFEHSSSFTIVKGPSFNRRRYLLRLGGVVARFPNSLDEKICAKLPRSLAKKLSERNTKTFYCIRFDTQRLNYPDADRLLAVKLMIDTDERQFLKIAHVIGRSNTLID